MNKKTIKDVQVKGKKCLVRVDFNVPMKDGVITDENRINGALPTIKYLMDNGAKVILCSHMGKPHNVFNEVIKLNKKEKKAVEKADPKDKDALTKEFLEKAKKDLTKYSLKPVSERLNQLLDGKVTFATDTVGEDAIKKVNALKDGEVVLLENLRFDAGEEGKDIEFCKKLASFCDIYVNDAFGTAHRSHASTAAIVEYGLVDEAVCGFLIEKELSIMADSLENPERPFVAVLGGAKVADKLNVISNLLEKCDSLIIGGGMAYTFLKALGYEVGTSLVDLEKIDYCKEMLLKAESLGKKLYLPIDTTVASSFPDPIDAEIEVEVVDSKKIPSDKMGLDIGPKTMELFSDVILGGKTIIWNGPMGVFENPTLAKGTMQVAKAMSLATSATTIIGGGDSAAAVAQLGYADKMSHISTGGGASLELFEGKILPGIACLNEKKLRCVMRKPIIAGNWKMNLTPSQGVELVNQLKPLVKDADCDVVVCVPATDVYAVGQALKGSNIKLGAENVHFAENGAYTGEISADMLLELGVEYVIVGHSERRQYFNETDKTVNLRTLQAIKKGLVPIVCVGETLSEREEGKTEEVLKKQIVEGLQGVEDLTKIVIAYEPVWAIGTGKTATSEQANQTIGYIRNLLKEVFCEDCALKVRIQYGGSMKPSNAKELMAMSEIDGGLIGGASLKAEDFAKIVNFNK